MSTEVLSTGHRTLPADGTVVLVRRLGPTGREAVFRLHAELPPDDRYLTDLNRLGREVLALMSWQPLPRGRRVAVGGNAGGATVLAADVRRTEWLETDHTPPTDPTGTRQADAHDVIDAGRDQPARRDRGRRRRRRRADPDRPPRGDRPDGA
jgi:hypothetical protein